MVCKLYFIYLPSNSLTQVLFSSVVDKDPEEGSWVICSRSYICEVLDSLDLSDFKVRALSLDSGFYTI